MPKKRAVKKAKVHSKKVSKKHSKASKKTPEPVQKMEHEPVHIPLNDALRDLEKISDGKKMEQRVENIEKKESKMQKNEIEIMKEEAKIEKETEKIEKETERIEKVEKQIKKSVTVKPLSIFTMKDLNKAIVGAFVGIVAHYAFVYGKEIAKNISMTRASFLIIFSYILIIILMYETGYREVKEKRFLGILPKRATAIYLTSIIVIIIVFFLFNQLNLNDLPGLYKEISVTLVLASVGAGSADLIGKD
ncbi:MAG: hypothetical protein AABX00_01270 [Nanoarchaeota archaeon]